jgi:hypothetical protein
VGLRDRIERSGTVRGIASNCKTAPRERLLSIPVSRNRIEPFDTVRRRVQFAHRRRLDRLPLALWVRPVYDLTKTRKTFFGKASAELTPDETNLLNGLQQTLVADSLEKLAQADTSVVPQATAPGTCRGPCFACSLAVVATPGFPIDELAFCIACFICLGV